MGIPAENERKKGLVTLGGTSQAERTVYGKVLPFAQLPSEEDIITVPILQIRKLRLRKRKFLAWRHPARTGESSLLSPPLPEDWIASLP